MKTRVDIGGSQGRDIKMERRGPPGEGRGGRGRKGEKSLMMMIRLFLLYLRYPAKRKRIMVAMYGDRLPSK